MCSTSVLSNDILSPLLSTNLTVTRNKQVLVMEFWKILVALFFLVKEENLLHLPVPSALSVRD